MTPPLALTHITAIVGDSEGTIHSDWTIVVGADGLIEEVGPAGSAHARAARPGSHSEADATQRGEIDEHFDSF